MSVITGFVGAATTVGLESDPLNTLADELIARGVGDGVRIASELSDATSTDRASFEALRSAISRRLPILSSARFDQAIEQNALPVIPTA